MFLCKQETAWSCGIKRKKDFLMDHSHREDFLCDSSAPSLDKRVKDAGTNHIIILGTSIKCSAFFKYRIKVYRLTLVSYFASELFGCF